MQMTIFERDDITHVVLNGRLDTTAAEEISNRFAAATSAREKSAIVDLSAIDFMASRGIGLLFSNAKKLKSTGHRLVLLNPKGIVASVLKMSRVEQVMPVASDWDEAVGLASGVVAGPGGTTPSSKEAEEASRAQPSEPIQSVGPVTAGDLQVAIKNQLSELENLNVTVAQFLDAHRVPYRAAYAVKLAIDELVVNVIRYAYVDDDTHLIDLELVVDADQVILRIVDDGRPFDPRRGPALDLHAEDREAGGLGLILVLEMVDVLQYRRIGEKNWVEIRIHLGEHAHVPKTG